MSSKDFKNYLLKFFQAFTNIKGDVDESSISFTLKRKKKKNGGTRCKELTRLSFKVSKSLLLNTNKSTD